MMGLEGLRKEVIEAGKELLREGLVSRSWGNISIRVDTDHMLITPSGRTYDNLSPDELVLMDLQTLEYEGIIKPSSEFRLHAEVYKQRKDINAVIHTHQRNASTVAVARREIPPIIDDMAQIIGPSVRVTRYTVAGTKRFARRAVNALKGRQAALLANHGALCAGRNLQEAFVVSQILEKAAGALIEASFMGGAKSIPKINAIIMHQAYLKKYSKLDQRNRSEIKPE
ncbi:MAG: class II aldolase/adducin family protein [Bacteroidales bacterium]|nr:class II aldolase/adducin family protein [Bacteroidales bacterium]